MIIFPAIDIKDGKCVRLKQGKFDEVTIFSDEPYLVAKKWKSLGASYIHVVDLDGAKNGSSFNNEVIKKITGSISIPIQLGGGIRSLEDIEEKISLGVSRVILGTSAINDKEFVKKAVKLYGDKIAIGVDAKDGYVAIKGWQETSSTKSIDLCMEMKELGIKTIIYTDISKDGMMMGPNIEATKDIIEATGLNIITSGGVSCMDDVRRSKDINAYGTIIGKALYEGVIELSECIKKFEERTKMETKKIIACLDMKNGRVVKGINFVDIKDAGDPAETAELYCNSMADELVLLDITATNENRETMVDVVRRTAEKVTIPFTVGGGIRSIEEIGKVLDAGATKISINSQAIKNPDLINSAVEKFGKDCIVVAIDAKMNDANGYDVYINGGQTKVDVELIPWCKEVEKRGASAILITSIDFDGTKKGYDIKLTKMVSDAVNIDVIASGGAGKMEDFYEALTDGGAKSALGAGLFHFGEIKIPELKKYLTDKGIRFEK